jgi:hypothetical protein
LVVTSAASPGVPTVVATSSVPVPHDWKSYVSGAKSGGVFFWISAWKRSGREAPACSWKVIWKWASDSAGLRCGFATSS